ncbi:STT3 domain-containing protein [Nanoarchaeota archaeon]
MNDNDNINLGRSLNKAMSFLKKKNVMNIILIIILLALLIGGSWVRLQNLPLLQDSTTGNAIPLALDPFYFLRVAETIVAEDGLPAFDAMRNPSLEVGFTNEILPQVLVFMYKVAKVFNEDVSLASVDVIYPVLFFALGLLVFYFLIFYLTKSKTTAILSAAVLAFIPPYLYRTLAGFADHEAIGMFSSFLLLLGYAFALKFLNKQRVKGTKLVKTILFGALVGFLSALTIVSWGGHCKTYICSNPNQFCNLLVG